MRLKYALTAMTILTMSAVSALASEQSAETPQIHEVLMSDQGEYLGKLNSVCDVDPVALASADEFNDFPFLEEEILDADHKSVSKAFVYSFFVPGLGEYYSGSRLKAGVFFALDILSWSQYLVSHKSGTDKESDFQLFADEHWLVDRYIAMLVEDHNTDTDTVKIDGFTHQLGTEKDQQYYEKVGKWDQFAAGWDDAVWNGEYRQVRVDQNTVVDLKVYESAKRQQYLELRDDSNNKFKVARTWAMLSVANHVLSALDAAITAKRFNKKTSTFSQVNVKARLADYEGEKIPVIRLTYKF
jgi:hypothetical protein